MVKNELYHHGVKGQKWGVRRFQNKDGTLKSAGRKRYGDSNDDTSQRERKAKLVKRAVAATVITAAVAAGAVYAVKHPEKVAGVINKVKSIKVKDISGKAVEKGKNYVKTAVKDASTGFKEGIKEGIKEAPKRVGKGVVTGAVLLAAKRILDNTVGEEEATKISQKGGLG